MSYQAGRLCDECGGPSPYVPICGRCEDLAKCEAASHDAGYAEAVADIRQMLKGKLPEQETLIGGMVLILVDEWLATGAHVGASKRSGT